MAPNVALTVLRLIQPEPVIGTECSICMEPYMTKGLHAQACLPCGHVFGLQCVKLWLRNSQQCCPKCRVPCKEKNAVPLFNDQNEVIERLQQEIKRQQEQLQRLSSAQQIVPPAPHVASEVVPPALMDSSEMEVSKPEPIANEKPSKAAVAPAYFGLTNHRLPAPDSQFLDAFPSLDLLIASVSRNITTLAPSSIIHAKKHGKTGADANLPFGVVLYEAWTQGAKYKAHYIPLAMNAITGLKTMSRGQGADAKHFFLVGTNTGALMAIELKSTPIGFEANILVEITLANGRSSITALEWDISNKDVIYAAVSGVVVRMDLSKPKETASWVKLSADDTLCTAVFNLVSMPNVSETNSYLAAASSTGIYVVEWSYDQSIRNSEAHTFSEGDTTWQLMQPHPLFPNVVIAGCLQGLEQLFSSITLGDPKPEAFDLSPRLLLYRPSTGVSQTNNLTNSACIFRHAGSDYVLAAGPLAVLEIAPIDVTGKPPVLGAPKAKVPLISPHHEAQLQGVLHWKVLGTGDKVILAGLTATQILFLMPY